jgi:hypothetical protein
MAGEAWGIGIGVIGFARDLAYISCEELTSTISPLKCCIRFICTTTSATATPPNPASDRVHAAVWLTTLDMAMHSVLYIIIC